MSGALFNNKGNALTSVTVMGALAVTVLVGVAQLAANFSRRLSQERKASQNLSENELTLEYIKTKFTLRGSPAQTEWTLPEASTDTVRIGFTVQPLTSLQAPSPGKMPIRVVLGRRTNGSSSCVSVSPVPEMAGPAAIDVCDQDDYTRDSGDRASLQTVASLSAEEKQKAYFAVVNLENLSEADQTTFLQGNAPAAISDSALTPVQVTFLKYNLNSTKNQGELTVQLEDGSFGVVYISLDPPPECSSLAIKWSDTTHGRCDYSVSGTGTRVVISDGVSSFESSSLSGSMPCSPWNGSYGSPRFNATVYGSNGVSSSCPSKTLSCRMQMLLGSNSLNVYRGTQVKVNSDGGLTVEGVTYRHWLWLYDLTSAWSGIQSVSVADLTESINMTSVGQVAMAVSSSGSYGKTYSKHMRVSANSAKIVSYFSASQRPTPLAGIVPVSRTGDPSCIDCGLYITNCTNGTPAVFPPYPGMILHQNKVYDTLKP